MEKRKIFVIGHKNPDTDSVCSAIAYAQLKNEIDTENEYIPLRAGQTNEETQYVLKQFGVNAPQYVMDVKSQVKDIEIRKVDGVDRNISIKAAWKLMRDIGVVTLPITRDNKLEGLITIADIATSYMDVHDSTTLSTGMRSMCLTEERCLWQRLIPTSWRATSGWEISSFWETDMNRSYAP